MEGGEGNPPPEPTAGTQIKNKTRAEIRAEIEERNARLRDIAERARGERIAAKKAEIAKRHSGGMLGSLARAIETVKQKLPGKEIGAQPSPEIRDVVSPPQEPSSGPEPDIHNSTPNRSKH